MQPGVTVRGQEASKRSLVDLGDHKDTENKAKAGKATGNVISPNSRTQEYAGD
jgi:hypothetical protein